MSFGEGDLHEEVSKWRAASRGLWHDLKHAEPDVAANWLVAWPMLREEVESDADMVDHPAHYAGAVEAIEVIEGTVDGLKGKDAARLANILKYALRAGKKGDAEEDIAKANNYAHRLFTGRWRWEGRDMGVLTHWLAATAGAIIGFTAAAILQAGGRR